jgi:hypothetical protein
MEPTVTPLLGESTTFEKPYSSQFRQRRRRIDGIVTATPSVGHQSAPDGPHLS